MTLQKDDFICLECVRKSKWKDKCSWCGYGEMVLESELESRLKEREETLRWLDEDYLKIIEQIKLFTVDTLVNHKIVEELGLVFGSSSKLAFWGLSKQQKRLESAYEIASFNIRSEAAMIDADAIVGVKFALNNSTGSAMNIAGSSEAVMLIGTAVKLAKTDID